MAEDGLAPMTKGEKVELVVRAATVDATVPVTTAPFAGVVEKVTYSPSEAVTGAATNFRTLKVVNKGAKAEGTNVVAELVLESGHNLVADEENVIPLNGEAAKLVVAEGDELVVSTIHSGTGLADPGGLVKITFKRT